MSERLNSDQVKLGQIETRIVGMQYAAGAVQPGEPVALEREHDNLHDRWAVSVKNQEGQHVGYLPREVSSWLGKLMDEGKVVVTAAVPCDAPSYDQEPGRGCPLRITVHLTREGLKMLEPNPSPENDIEALQEVVRSTFVKLDEYTSPRAVIGLARRLQATVRWDASPETHLMLALFHSKAEEIRNDPQNDHPGGVREAIDRLVVGEPIHHGLLTLFPLRKPGGSCADYILLSEALRSGAAVLEEVSREGRVDELLLRNKGEKPILLPEGEILEGAKQNRIINISLMAAAKTSTPIPVSCVERGRWSYRSWRFEPRYFAHPRLRRLKTRTVWEAESHGEPGRSDQGAVWQEVSSHLRASRVCSKTDSISDAYRSVERTAREYREKTVLPDDSVGIMVCEEEYLVGLDIFDSAEIFRKCWERIADSYFSELTRRRAKRKRSSPACAQEYLKKIRDAIEIREPVAGIGQSIRLNTNELAGTGVWFDGSLCHLSAFGTGELGN